MSIYKNAVLETMYRTVNGVKELTGTASFTYDPTLEKFKGFWIHPDGNLDPYYFKFTSDREVVWEWVDDFTTTKLKARNKFIFPDQDHMNGTHYNGNEVQYGYNYDIFISYRQNDNKGDKWVNVKHYRRTPLVKKLNNIKYGSMISDFIYHLQFHSSQLAIHLYYPSRE
jgi:hypothetical protein